MRQKIYLNVPARSRVDKIIAGAKLQGAVRSQTLAESDGQFTVIVEYPGAEPPPTMPASETLPAGWINIAHAEVGVVEAAGAASNPRIEAYHATTSGGEADDSVPWCSSFVNYCITKSGLKGTDSKRARSWLQWGAPSQLRPGCIVVLERGDPEKGHVGFFAGMDGDRIRLLGGNQSDKVGLASFEADRVIGVRWPTNVALTRMDTPQSALTGLTSTHLPPLRRAFDLPSLHEEYQRCLAACVVSNERRAAVERTCDTIEVGRARYDSVSARSGVPWYVIALLHHMECGCDFDEHLHNGDPLSARTVRRPAGRPEAPPTGPSGYRWEESAEDALADLRGQGSWSSERLLFHAERYNGWGYRTRGLPSPYLWSGSNLYVKGKFIRDGLFDPEAVSEQLGVAVVLRRLIDRGSVQ